MAGLTTALAAVVDSMDIAALIFAQLAVLGSASVEAIAIDALDVRMADLIRVISGAQIGALSIGVAPDPRAGGGDYDWRLAGLKKHPSWNFSERKDRAAIRRKILSNFELVWWPGKTEPDGSLV